MNQNTDEKYLLERLKKKHAVLTLFFAMLYITSNICWLLCLFAPRSVFLWCSTILVMLNILWGHTMVQYLRLSFKELEEKNSIA